MASLVARTAHTVSQSWSSAVAGIWKSVGGSLSSSVLQFRSYSDEGLDGRVPPSPEASSAAETLVNTPLPGELPPAVPKTETFGAYRPVHDRNAYPLRKLEGVRVHRTPRGVVKATVLGKVGQLPIAISKRQLNRTALNEDESPVGSCRRAFGNVAQESGRHDSPRQRFVCGNELPIGSAHGGGNTHLGEAIAALKNRQQQGIIIDSYTFVEVLKRCSRQKDLTLARQVHESIIQSGMDKHPYVATTLLNVYIKCGRLQDARRVFDVLDKTDRNVVTWNVMIGAYAKSGCGVEAYRLFLQMQRECFKPDAFTYASILNASASAGALEWVKEVHDHARREGLESDLLVGSALVHMYAKSGSIHDARQVFDRMQKRDVVTWNIMIGAYAKSGRLDDARLVFDRMENRDVVTWNTLIGAYAESGCGVEAHRLLLQMKREGFKPDPITFINILNASASARAGALEWAKEVHSHALQAGLESDLRVGSALIHMYAKSGSIRHARLIFDRLKTRDVKTWNIMIGAYAETGLGVTAYRLFLQMKREGFKPDAITYASVLNASGSVGALEWVKEVHGDARRAGLESDLRVGNALVHSYAKSGTMDDARLLFHRMEKRDVVTWNALIGGLAHHGSGHEALELFRKMNDDCVKPNGISFVAVLSACSHAGLLDDGRRLFSAMTQDYGISPTVVHYTCMVDLLGRAGLLEEARLLIEDMPIDPVGVTWKALLGACRTYGDVELGKFAAKEALKLEPKDPAAYVLLSNIYAAAGKWEEVSSLRTMMQERGVRKKRGRSRIEVDNKIHEFAAGDTSHPEAKAIYAVLKNLTEELKAEGYVPDTKLVLQNVDEEEKELALCYHSEKLAIAYGLLCIPRGKPIRVFKNLRVCSDCHTATKFISTVTGREIIARDSHRFHHFKNGVCSCGDYW